MVRRLVKIGRCFTVEGKALVIEALKTYRAGWFDGYRPEADEDAWAALPVDEISEEWGW